MSRPDHAVQFTYVNWKGESGLRRVRPTELWFGTTSYHPEPQWFLKAHDIDKDAERDFAMRDITGWRLWE